MANDTKLKIAEIAFELFLKNGYKKTTIREIAEICDVTHANVLYHYKNKFDLGLFFQRTYLNIVDKYVISLAEEKLIPPSVERYALYWLAHYMFMLEHSSFAVFYEEFTNMNRQEIAADKISYGGYVKMASIYTGAQIAYREPELSLNMYLLIEADVQMVRLISCGEMDIFNAMVYYIKNSLRLLTSYDANEAEITDTVYKVMELQREIQSLIKQIEQDLLVKTAE